eukprot:m.300581 g.300581  ORF g.300581 m.300581 type:complete len:210 (-) comp14498_c0_seq1:23-652(-)
MLVSATRLAATAPRVLLMGEPLLRQTAAPVGAAVAAVAEDAQRLLAALAAFRATHGFGRAIAAPQIGVSRRMVACDLSDRAAESPEGLRSLKQPFVMYDPEITWRSSSTFTLWDDCMSFPDLLVRVQRSSSISIAFTTGTGERVQYPELPRDLSELFQHEFDHLDGRLSVDIAHGRNAIVTKSVYKANRSLFDAEVDYVIPPIARSQKQ